MPVYFIQNEAGHVKIGLAENPEQRLAGLSCGSSQQLKIIRVIDGGRYKERWLHNRFKADHIRGEWFRYNSYMMTVKPPEWQPLHFDQPTNAAVTSGDMKTAIDRVGGISALARALGVSRQAVHNWKRIPVEHVLTIERMSGVSRHALRPDVYPREDATENAGT